MSADTSRTAAIRIEETTRTLAETQALGRALGALLRAAAADHQHEGAGALVVALYGDLGAGKTALTQGIAAGMGIDMQVTSPTFTLINEYETADGIRLFHVDGYRLGDAATDAGLEAAAMGLDELLAEDGVVVIEWAERIASLLPADHVDIYLSYGEEQAETRDVEEKADEPGSQLRHILCRAAGTFVTAPFSNRLLHALDAARA